MSKANIKPPDDDELLEAIVLVTGVSHDRADAMVPRIHNQDDRYKTTHYDGWDYNRLGRRRMEWIARSGALSAVMFHEHNMPLWKNAELEKERLRNMSYTDLLFEFDRLEALDNDS